MLPSKSLQRGSAQTVVLVVTILLLVGVVVMWWSAKEDATQATQARDAAVKAEGTARLAANAYLEGWGKLSRLVGWVTKPVDEIVPADAKALAGGAVVTDTASLEANLRPDGEVAGAEGAPAAPGLLRWLRENSTLDIDGNRRTGKHEEVPGRDADLGWMTPEFRQKLVEVQALQEAVPAVPQPPADSDDEAAKAEHAERLREYEAAVTRYNAGVAALTAMPPYKKYSEVVRAGSGWTIDDKREVIRTLEFFKEPGLGDITVQHLLEFPKKVIQGLKDEFIANKKADIDAAAQVTTEKDSLETQLADFRRQLEEEQQRHTTDVANLNSQLEEARRQVEANRLGETTARNQLAALEQEKAAEAAAAAREIAARDERIRGDKEKRDLEIRRNDADGRVLSASPGMGTVIIDLGSADKAFPGLKFDVYQLGRGGFREPKGTVMVTRVTGPHSAQAAVGEQVGDTPIGQGDTIHNPFYSGSEPIHVWFAGPISKYPREIALARLAKLGVVVDSSMSGDTDYAVIPNSMTAPEPTGEGDDAPAPGQSELDRIRALAREFGATVITEEMLNRFIGY